MLQLTPQLLVETAVCALVEADALGEAQQAVLLLYGEGEEHIPDLCYVLAARAFALAVAVIQPDLLGPSP